ncbi:MAG: hypothetical protein RIQ47_1744 [Bacteroidota bacterium]
MIGNLFHRIRSDYFLSSRMNEYKLLLQTALDTGYSHQTLPEFFNSVISGKRDGKIFIHRHDIDTDPATARRFFEIEQKLGVRSSFYFRLSTLDIPLMKEIHGYGSEVGYHYEELATFCKRNKVKSSERVNEFYPQIRTDFTNNFNRLQDKLGFKLKSVASHGDFVNRKIGVPNYSVLNQQLLSELGIEFECYDKRLLDAYSMALSDTISPNFYKPNSPFESIRESRQVIYLLTHPRHWYCSPLSNTHENITRLVEGIKFSI